MNHKICFLFLLLLVGFEACKKEEEYRDQDGNGLVMLPYAHAYFRSVVVDSVTGVPVPGASIYMWSTPYTGLGGNSGVVTNGSGTFVTEMSWGGDPRYHHRPPDNADLYVQACSDSKYGFLKFKAGLLVENDTIDLPNTLANSIGYVNLHIKDTSGFVSGACNVSAQYLILPATGYNFNFPSGNSFDTTVIWKAYPNRSVRIGWPGLSGYPSAGGVLNVFVNPNDTSYVNVFY
ncbi:MAG: hypothetical protein JWO44_1720 [Bacteroidetes bacterium]|nr:hypothetical protein [Bacteroidota bacterium]